ncbi:MAG: hypothetical protein JSV97_03875, partial [candidate division WOR-3 bacterium]
MSVTIAGNSGTQYDFKGPFISPDKLEDKPGVYAILCEQSGRLDLIDLGESDQVKTRIENHDRKPCWERNCTGTINYAVYYIEHSNELSRIHIEQD